MPTPIHSVYEPLYLNDDKFIVLITGGRGSGKSYEVSRYIERLTFEQGQKILFSRYTMTSADKSIIPEVLEKIQGDGTAEYFNIKQDRIQNLRTQSEIIFMGIKASCLHHRMQILFHPSHQPHKRRKGGTAGFEQSQ